MKTILMSVGLALVGVAVAGDGGLYADGPDVRHAWGVHDRNRPLPAKVESPVGVPPSDAIVLFDGTPESVAANWEGIDGGSTRWKVADGAFICVPRSGKVRTKRSFADCQLHVEWFTPTNLHGTGQSRGNSGVILMGRYEIQVLDSYETNPALNPIPNPNYADGMAGAFYGQNPPLVNPSRPAGSWQTYDIVFHPPYFENGRQVDPGSISCFFNGVLVQDAWPIEGRCQWRMRTQPDGSALGPAPLVLQDHGNPVPFRNIWIREIPSRFANTVHGGPNVKTADVTALRKATAQELLAKIDLRQQDGLTLCRLMEVLQYDPSEANRACVAEASRRYLERINAWDVAQVKLAKDELIAVCETCTTLARAKLIAQDDPVLTHVRTLVEANKWKYRK